LRAQRAVWHFQAGGRAAVQFLGDRLEEMFLLATKKQMDQIPKLLMELDAPSFRRRKKAAAGLELLGMGVLPRLRKELRNQPSVEVENRLKILIHCIENRAEEQSWRLRRLLQILESARTPRAKAILERLAREGHEIDMVAPALLR